jgi:polysaccharide pyruvyl transferase WcaK-like protein
MNAQELQSTLMKEVSDAIPSVSGGCSSSFAVSNRTGPRVALLTPYTGGNFGDAAIQDAMISNLRLRLPTAQFSGISLNSENYLQRHGSRAFPLCAFGNSFYGMAGTGKGASQSDPGRTTGPAGFIGSLKAALRRIPGARWLIKLTKPRLNSLLSESRHFRAGYRFLRSHDIVIVCGGGQLDEEWGGAWGHPFALFKWAVISKFARVPFLLASVGAGKTTSKTTHFFLSSALRLARYRSYRDRNSRDIAAGLFSPAAEDSVVPDLAFSLPPGEIPSPAGLRALAKGRTIVAISPIVYAKPGLWPTSDGELYNRYLDQLTGAISKLLKRNNFLVFVWSSRGDEPVVPELLARLDAESKELLAQQSYISKLANWKDLLAVLQDADFLIASRLHSTILGFLVGVPLIAISFDPKVDWAMRDLGQSDFLLQIGQFKASGVIEALACLELRKDEAVRQLAAYREQVLQSSAHQFDILARLATASASRLHLKSTFSN